MKMFVKISHSAWLFVLLIFMLAVTACTAPAEPAAVEAPEAGSETTETDDDEMAAEEAASETASESEESAETAAAETRTVTDAAGNEVDVPVDPQRVVALSERDMDAAFALGAPVVGVIDGRGAMEPPAYLRPYLGDAVSVGGFSAPSPEAILNLNPDLILIGGIFPALDEILPDLRQIAPVYISFNLGDDWKTALMGTAAALNQTAEAEAWLADYEARAAAIATGVPAGMEVSIVRFNPDGPVIMSPASFASTVAAEAGFSRPEAHMDIEGQGHSDTISLETLQTIDADHLFIGSLNPDGTAVLETALDDPLYQALNAFQNDAVTVVDGAAWTTLGGPLAAQIVLEAVAVVADKMAMAGAETAAAVENSPLPRTVTDVNGAEVVIENDSTLIALDGPLTEIVYALGAGDRLVATDVSSVYPEAATQLPKVGYVRNISAEPVLAMAPALILTTDSAGPPEALAQLEESGVTIAMFKAPETIEDSIALVRSVAAALGKEAEGEAIVAEMEADLAEAAELLAQTEGTPRVMFLYARGPDTVSAAGYGTSIDVMFELAGVENAITEWEGYQPLTAEGAVTAAPDALLLFSSGLESVGGPEGLLGVPGLAQTPAGDAERIFAMDGLLLTGLGPRVGEAVTELIMMLHPEVAE